MSYRPADGTHDERRRPKLRVWAVLGFIVSACALLSFSTAPARVSNAEADPLKPAQPQRAGVGLVDREDRIRTRERTSPSESLYILDSNHNKEESQVLVIDVEDGRVIKTFKAGSTPDIALSPDGKRLYIASTWWTTDRRGGGTLDVFDTASDALLKRIDNPDRGLSTLPEYPSTMVISKNGRWLYIYKVHQTLGGDEHYVATFDTHNGRFLSEVQKTPFCGGYGILQPLLADRQLAVVCRESSDVRFLDLARNGSARSRTTAFGSDATGAPTQKVSILSKRVPEHGHRVGPAFLSSDGVTLTIIMGDGRFLRVDNGSRTILEKDRVDGEARESSGGANKPEQATSRDWLADSWIRYQAPALSTDGSKLYVGIGRLVHLQQGVQLFDRIAVFDSKTLRRVGIIKTSQLFYSMVLSKDGRHLYAVSPEQASVMVIDAATQQEVRTIYGMGRTPIRAIVAP
jgi:YVTN family beta-propeller protein